MDSPVRKMLKRNDYNRHKLLRKIKRLRKAQVEQQKVAAEKELKRRLRVTPPKFGDGKDPQYKANTFAGRVTGFISGDQDKVNTADLISSAISMIPLVGLVPSSLDLGYDLNRLYHNRDYETAKDVGMDALSMIPLMPKVRFNLAKKAVDPMLYTLLNIYKKYGKYVNKGLWGVRGADSYLDVTDHDVQKHDNGKRPTLLDADKVRMNEQGLFLDEAGNIVGDSVVLPEISVRPTTPQTNNNYYYPQWLMRQADRGGRNMSSSDREAYDRMMSRVANQNEVKNFTGFDGTIYNHGNGALEQVSPEFDALTLGRQFYTDGLFDIIGAVGKNALKKAHIKLGNINMPFYKRYSYGAKHNNFTPLEYAYNRKKELSEIGTIDDYEEYIKTVFPQSMVKDIQYHTGPKGLTELKPSTGEIWNTNPGARGIYVTPERSYIEAIRKFTTDRLEKPSALTYIKRNLTPNGWREANEQFTDVYPLLVDTRNPMRTRGNWTWGMKDKKYQEVMNHYDAIINSGPRWWQNINKMPEIIVPKSEQVHILGTDADIEGFRNFMIGKKKK